MQSAAEQLEASWQRASEPLPLRGAKLASPRAEPHPVYAAQRLFSMYVHTPPGTEAYPPESIFHGREILPHAESTRFTHSLAKLSLYLLEAALMDTTVHNARFVTLSEACAPIYNGNVMYLEVMREAKSRVPPDRPNFLDNLRASQVRLSRPISWPCALPVSLLACLLAAGTCATRTPA